MNSFRQFRLRKVVLVVLLSVALTVNPALAKSPVKLQHWVGAIDLSADNPVPFTLAGTASHLGQFTAHGEVSFHPGEQEGTLIGLGVVVFTAANGDLLVGNVTWEAEAAEEGLRTSHIHFSWADSIEVNGTVVENTGRFVDDRPPGLVVIAIIAVLIGLLLPAVQKCKPGEC